MAAVLWGTTGTAQTFAPVSTHPMALGAVRLAIGGGTLLFILILSGQFSLKTRWPVRPILLAAACMACYQPFFFSAVYSTGVAVGTVVAIGSAPVLAGMLEWIFWKRPASKIWWAATALSIIGCLMLFVNKDSVYIDPYGVFMALGAGLTFALYTIVSKELVDQFTPLMAMAIVFSLSALLLIPVLFMFDLTWLREWQGMAVSIHLGVIATALAYVLFSKGLTSITSSTAVTLSLAEPLTAALLGVFFVGEQLTTFAWFGISFIFIGITLLSLKPKLSKL